MVDDIDLKHLDSTKVGTAKVGGNTVLSLKESLTFENCEDFETIFNQVISQAPPVLILDFKSVGVLDSKALELLIRTHDKLKGKRGVLKLAGLNVVCKDILMVTRLINYFHVHEDIGDAVRS